MDDKGKSTLGGSEARVERARVAAEAMAQAEDVRRSDAGEDTSCLCCQRRVPLARIVVHWTTGAGLPGANSGFRLMGGVCADCIAAGSETRSAQVAELARAAAQVDSLLHLIRSRAETQLTSWWGTVGACSTVEVDRASVELRRAIERLGVKP